MYAVTAGHDESAGAILNPGPAALALLSHGDGADGAAAVCVTFPGLAAVVPSARRFVRGILADCPRAYDLELIACEMISNAIRHTPAGEPRGVFTLTIRTGPGRARIEVSGPSSGEWHQDEGSGCPDDEDGRGLAIIAALADAFGHDVDAIGQTVWAQADWPED